MDLALASERIISELARLASQQLVEIPRTTAMHYRGSHKAFSRIGRVLHVQLIQISDQEHLFATN